MGMKSQKNGNAGERIVESFLRSRGYWVHVTKRGANGSQPVDIIAIRSGKAILMDAKYVSQGKNGRFYLEDVQPDQITSMSYARDFADIRNIGFAIVFEGWEESPSFLPFEAYEGLVEMGVASVAKDEMLKLSEWEGRLWR